MSARVKLSEIIEAMEMLTDESSAHVNTKTGEVVSVTDEELAAAKAHDPLEEYPEWQRDVIRTAGEILQKTGDYVPLPDKFEIHEWAIMERFCRSLPDGEVADTLARAIHGNGAFRRFKDDICQLGVEKAWYEFRADAFRQLAREWCEANKIEYADE